MRTSRSYPAFTLIELLVVVAIIALLISILLPSLRGAREQAKRAKCLANFSNFGRAAHMNASEDKKNRLHTPHPNNFEEPNENGGTYGTPYYMGSGDHCWGGKDGEVNIGGQWGYEYDRRGVGSHPGKEANGRFMNRMLFSGKFSGGQLEDPREWAIFQEPGDDTMWGTFQVNNMTFTPRNPMYSESIFKATGNSYSGDTFVLKDHRLDGRGGAYMRVGAYGRKSHAFSDAGRNLLFFEPRFIQAMFNTAEIGTAGFNPSGGSFWQVRPGMMPQDITGAHGQIGKFNASFADGHGATISCKSRGDMQEPVDFRDGQTEFWRLYWRGTGWKYDNLPQMKHYQREWFDPWNDPRVMWMNDLGAP